MSDYTAPPPPPGGYEAPSYGVRAGGELAAWPLRVGAFLIDYLLYVPGYILYILGAPKATTVTSGGTSSLVATGGSTPLMLVGALYIVAIAIWNRWLRGGAGQSLGKRVVGLRLLGESTGQPIGAGQAFLRDVAHIVDSIICYIGFLFPLWDAKRQTIADKIVKSVVVRV